MTNYRKLKVWEAGLDLLEYAYAVTEKYPRGEMFGLVSQTRRATVSILANLAEGLGRGHKKDSIHFLIMARGSGYEVEALLSIALRLKFIEPDDFVKGENYLVEIFKMLSGLIRFIEVRHA